MLDAAVRVAVGVDDHVLGVGLEVAVGVLHQPQVRRLSDRARRARAPSARAASAACRRTPSSCPSCRRRRVFEDADAIDGLPRVPARTCRAGRSASRAPRAGRPHRTPSGSATRSSAPMRRARRGIPAAARRSSSPLRETTRWPSPSVSCAGGQMLPGVLAVPCRRDRRREADDTDCGESGTIPARRREFLARCVFLRHESNDHARRRRRQPESGARARRFCSSTYSRPSGPVVTARTRPNCSKTASWCVTCRPLISSRRSCCPASAATNRLFFQPGILRAGVERDAARRDRRRVVDDGQLHAGSAALGDAVLLAHRDHAPAVVLALLDDVDLVAAGRTVLRFPEQAGDRIPRQSLRIAMTVATRSTAARSAC